MLTRAFDFRTGYFLSFLLPYRWCGLAAVAWAVFWGLIFSGAPGAMQIHENAPLKFIFYSPGCVEINQCVGYARKFFTKSYLGDDVAAPAPSSGEEPIATSNAP